MLLPHQYRASDKIYEAVQEAQCSGFTVRQFIETAWQCWSDSLAEEGKNADSTFKKVLDKL